MSIHNSSFKAWLVILSVLLLFRLYYLIRKHKIISQLLLRTSQDQAVQYFSEKFIGFILFGIIPFLVFIRLPGFITSDTILTFGSSSHYWYIPFILLILVTVITFIFSKKKTMQAKYPQLRIKTWTVKYSLISISGWIIYILGYEFFFRGILLFVCFSAFGFWPSLLINILLYAIVHLDQGPWISLGAIPAGIIFCLLTLLTSSFFYAFLIHSYMAISNELFSVYHNPDLSFKLKQKGSGL